MVKIAKKYVALLIITTLILAPFGSAVLAQDEHFSEGGKTAERMLADMAIRPLGLAATVVGTVLFILSYPFSAWGENSDEAYQVLVVEPARYTFKRPLGEL